MTKMTNFRNTFLHGCTTGPRQWRIVLTVYVLQVCLAFTVGMQVYEVLEASIGRSLEINKLLHHYDHTVLTDFLSVHGASITPLIGQLRWLLPVWLLFSVFINAGMLYCAAFPERASWRAFWQGGAAYFFPFLKIALFFWALALVWTVAVWLPVAVNMEPALENLPSEQYVVWGVGAAAAIWLPGLAVLFVWSVLGRLQYLQTATPLIYALKNGGRLFWNKKMSLLGLLAGFAGLQLLVAVVYYMLESSGGMTSTLSVVLFFGLQQIIVFC
ncbi:MAG: hypothetical protein L6Q97_21915, partial [Thermoanaerobaculia bacterium]|nr:hypothetical protein [Thermoanaerobaculia bacterium]